MPAEERDVFLCHASEDKAEIVRPLTEAFEQKGISCWLDEAEILLGDSIPDKVSEGLLKSRYLLVVLNSAFIRKSFALEELNFALYQQLNAKEVKVLPVLVGSKEQILQQFPLLRSRCYAVWNDNPDQVVEMVEKVLAHAPRFQDRCESLFYFFGVSSTCIRRPWSSCMAINDGAWAHLNVDVVLPTPSGYEYQFSIPQVQLRPLDNAEASYDKTISWLRFANVAAETMIDVIYRDTRPDVIHCHDWVTVLAGIKCRWALKIPLVFHLHLPNPSRLCASVENLGLICADLVTVNSQAMHRELMDRNLPLRRDTSVAVVKNGVDLKVFCPCEDWPADGGYILFVGRLVQQKGVEYLLRGFPI